MNGHSTSTELLSPTSEPAAAADQLTPALAYAFAPMHKRAFGVATGTAAALLVALVTVAALVLPGAREFPLELLTQFFTGYAVSWRGVVIGAAWGFVVGFVGGWFTAFCRNLALAITALLITARAELTQTRDFLDHI